MNNIIKTLFVLLIVTMPVGGGTLEDIEYMEFDDLEELGISDISMEYNATISLDGWIYLIGSLRLYSKNHIDGVDGELWRWEVHIIVEVSSISDVTSMIFIKGDIYFLDGTHTMFENSTSNFYADDENDYYLIGGHYYTTVDYMPTTSTNFLYVWAIAISIIVFGMYYLVPRIKRNKKDEVPTKEVLFDDYHPIPKNYNKNLNMVQYVPSITFDPKCRTCGTDNTNDSLFCIECGASL